MTQDQQPQMWSPDDQESARQRSQAPYAPYDPQRAQWTPPQTPKKHRARNVLLSILGGFAVLIVVSAIASAGKSSGSSPVAAATTSAASSAAKTASHAAAPAAPAAPSSAQPVAAQVTYACTGNAPDGIDITYGPSGSDYSATSLPFTKTAALDDSAGYYVTTAQLSGSGSVTCTTTVQASDGTQTVSTASAQGGYNIANAEVCGDFTGGWQKC